MTRAGRHAQASNHALLFKGFTPAAQSLRSGGTGPDPFCLHKIFFRAEPVRESPRASLRKFWERRAARLLRHGTMMKVHCDIGRLPAARWLDQCHSELSS